MSEPALLADHLDQHTEAILAVWRATVERVGDIPEAERLSYTEFVDHVPRLLERIADRLRGRTVDAALVGRSHGQHRWKQGYDIAEIVIEFGHLRTALGRATTDYARQHQWDVARLESALEAINNVLDEATAESVRQFQEDSRAETQKALAEVKRRQQSIEDAWITAKLEKTKLRTILSSLPVAVWVVDAEGTIIGVNDEADRLQGIVQKESVGRTNVRDLGSDYLLYRPDLTSYPREELPIIRALRGQVVTQEELIWVIRAEPRTVSINAAPLIDNAGAIVGAVAVVQDITQRKALEQRLAASESRFRSIAEKSPVMIWRTDVLGRCDYVNQTWVEFRGRAVDDELGDGWLTGIHRDDRERYREHFRVIFAQREPFEMTYRMLRRDGQFRWISDRGTPYHDADGAFLGYLGSRLDIHDRVEQEEALQRERLVAEEASRHKTRLVSALSHDARTPLNAVVLAAQLLEIHCHDEADDEVQSCLRTIRHSVRNVLDLLGDLLDLSKLDAGVLPLEVSRFPLEPCLAECLGSIETQAHQKGLDVRLELGPLHGKSLETDRSKFKQILSNLVSNALRYTERGHIRVYAEQSDDQIRIAVEDSGIGIATVDQGKIFDEFAVLNHPQRAEGGTGLGLAICHRLATLLRGQITLKSAPGAGSTFTLVLPGACEAPDVPANAAGATVTSSPRQRGAIVVAEDHPDSRQTLAKVLRRMGYQVLEASNGQEAVNLVHEGRAEAVLMDVNMPVMDGIEATLTLRRDPSLRDLAIFALTGDVTPVNQHRIEEAGVNGYLEKPVTIEALKQALSLLERRDGHQPS